MAYGLADLLHTDRERLNRALLGLSAADMLREADPLRKVRRWFTEGCYLPLVRGIDGFRFKTLVDKDEKLAGIQLPSQYKPLFDWIREQQVGAVFLRRNELDVLASMVKHQHKPLASNCDDGNTDCVSQHLGTKVRLPVGKSLLDGLHKIRNQYGDWIAFLQSEVKLAVHVVAFETMLSGSLSERKTAWQPFLEFVGADQKVPLSLASVHRATTYLESTSPFRQDKKITNFAEVLRTLENTSFEDLLH